MPRTSKLPRLGQAWPQRSGPGPRSGRERGFAAVLIALYGVLAFAATGRAVFELLAKFGQAPLSYSLSLVSALTYALMTVLLIRRGGDSRPALWVCSLELLGVVTVGTLSFVSPHLFRAHTVWSHFGIGYGLLPLLLPLAAITYLLARRRQRIQAGSVTA